MRNRRAKSGKDEGRAHEVPARVVRLRAKRASNDDAGQRAPASGPTVRRRVDALRAHDARGLARLGSLRPARRIPPHEWDRTAGESTRTVTLSMQREARKAGIQLQFAFFRPTGLFIGWGADGYQALRWLDFGSDSVDIDLGLYRGQPHFG